MKKIKFAIGIDIEMGETESPSKCVNQGEVIHHLKKNIYDIVECCKTDTMKKMEVNIARGKTQIVPFDVKQCGHLNQYDALVDDRWGFFLVQWEETTGNKNSCNIHKGEIISC